MENDTEEDRRVCFSISINALKPRLHEDKEIGPIHTHTGSYLRMMDFRCTCIVETEEVSCEKLKEKKKKKKPFLFFTFSPSLSCSRLSQWPV